MFVPLVERTSQKDIPAAKHSPSAVNKGTGGKVPLHIFGFITLAHGVRIFRDFIKVFTFQSTISR
jgi:hypothetical protein